MNTETLQQIGARHQTDKHDSNHNFCGSSYLDIYHKYLNGIRDLPLNILEIGVRDGCSHRMWKEYFPNSVIYGIDIDPRCKQSQTDGIRIFIGSQGDQQTINDVMQDTGGAGFDVILDDGSHVNSLTLKSFELLFPHVKQGGLYIIEDLGCSYLGQDLKEHIVRGGWPGMSYNKNIDFNNDRLDMDRFFGSIIHDIDTAPLEENHGGKTGVEWVHFYSRIAIMKKKKA
jgi:hypothetical protein